MWDFKACIVCLSTNVKLFNLDGDGLRRQYNDISGLKTIKGDGMPDCICFECVSYVKRFVKFRDKCNRANFTLKQLLRRDKEIKISTLNTLNRKLIGINPSLTYLDVGKYHYEEEKFHWTKNNRISITSNDEIPIVTYSTLTKEEMFQSSPVRTNNLELKDEDTVKIESHAESMNIGQIEITIDSDIKDPYQQPSSSFEESNTQAVEESNDYENNDGYESDNDVSFINNEGDNTGNVPMVIDDNADGSQLDPEYATILPITMREAKCVVEIYKMFGTGKHRCEICNKAFCNVNRLKVHLRMHDKHVSGNYHCELCNYYYKTDFLLRTHMTEKHMYKYICRKCPEVSFHRAAAKQHYIWAHLQKGKKSNGLSWRDDRPNWLSKKGVKSRRTPTARKPPRKKFATLPDDFLVYTPVSQEEQYQLVRERRSTKNYIEAKYRCEFCFRGFRVHHTYSKHMRKHDPAISGPLQCDMCKLYFRDSRKMYKHMNITHLTKFSCRECDYVCFNKSQAHTHYKWHRNVTYQCPHCDKQFSKISTHLTHIRMKHPSNHICNICGHSFVSETGLYCHKQISHTKEEVEAAAAAAPDPSGRFHCAECGVQFVGQDAYDVHLGSSNKHALSNISGRANHFREPAGGRRRKYHSSTEIVNNGAATSSSCVECGKYLVNDVQARKHYESEHPGTDFLKRYMCDVCGHTTKQYANLIVHMRTHTNEKPYQCPHCDRRFSMPSNRDRHIVVHTGEKRYQCHHCNRRFTQSSAVKLHIQTVHLKIPYAPWDKKNRKRRKELENAGAGAAAAAYPTPHKLVLDAQADYLNAYITYNDE